MVSKSVMPLTLASLLLLALASGQGEAMSSEKEEGAPVKRKLLGFFSRKKKEVSPPITQASSSSSSTSQKASLDFESESKNANPSYSFNPNYPPQTSDIQAFEKIWIPYFLEKPDAIDPKGYYKLILTSDDVHSMFQAPKRSKVSEALQGSSADPIREYIAFGGVLEASFRTNLIDSKWQAIFRANAKNFYAVFVSDEYRDKTTAHARGKIAEERSGEIVKYAAFRREDDEKIVAIKHPEATENILTFFVAYREKNK